MYSLVNLFEIYQQASFYFDNDHFRHSSFKSVTMNWMLMRMRNMNPKLMFEFGSGRLLFDCQFSSFDCQFSLHFWLWLSGVNLLRILIYHFFCSILLWLLCSVQLVQRWCQASDHLPIDRYLFLGNHRLSQQEFTQLYHNPSYSGERSLATSIHC